MGAHSEQEVRHLRRLVSGTAQERDSDAALLKRFVRRSDEEAFAALVRRYGPMVHGICRRMLRDIHRADDAYQATWLVLARKASRVRPASRLASWLYGVARHVACDILRAEARRTRREARSSTAPKQPDPLDELSGRELFHLVDEEIARLPEAYRLPVLLCCLEGRSQEEAARQLGWTTGSVKGRLERGRARLQASLVKRGLSLAAALGTVEASRSLAGGLAISATSVVKAAITFGGGHSVASTGVCAPVAALAETTLRSMAAAKLKLVAILLLMLTGLAAGVAAMANQALDDAKQTVQKKTPKREAATNKPTVATDRFGDPLPSGAVARLGTVRFRHNTKLDCFAISPDGKILAGGGGYGIQLWEAETGKTLGHIPVIALSWAPRALAFTPDGKLLASYYFFQHILQLNDVATGRTVNRFDLKELIRGNNSYTPSYLTFLPGGKHLLLGGGTEATVRLLDATNGQQVRAFPSLGKFLYGVALSPDAKTLAVREESGVVRLWAIATGKELLALPKTTGHGGVEFAPDGMRLATGEDNDVVKIWDAVTGKPLQTMEPRPTFVPYTDHLGQKKTWKNVLGNINSLSFSPDGKTLVANHPRTLVFWDLSTGTEIRRQTNAGNMNARYLPDGKTVVTSVGLNSYHDGNTPCFIDAATGQPRRAFDGHQGGICALAFSPDGKFIASGDGAGSFRLWDTSSSRTIFEDEAGPTLFPGQPGMRVEAAAVTFHPEGNRLAAAYIHGIRLWDLRDRKLLHTFQAKFPVAVAFTADGRQLASWERDGTIRLRDLKTGREVRNFQAASNNNRLTSAFNSADTAFSPDSRLAAFGGGWFWDMASGKETMLFLGDSRAYNVIVFSPDGRTLFSCNGSKNIYLWELASTGQRRAVKLPCFASALACSPDGRYVAISETSEMGVGREPSLLRERIHIYDVPRNRFIATLAGHEGRVFHLCFSPDGRTLASASSDTTVLLWDITALAGKERSATLTPEERAASWARLKGDAEEAYDSIWKLVAEKETVNFLRERLRPVGAPPPETQKWLGELSSLQFPVRSRAAKSLAESGPAVEPELRQALASTLSLETRVRVKALLGSLRTEQLRSSRAIEVLEYVNTPAAQSVLEALAKGRAGTWLTLEAQTSLRRMANRNHP